MSRIDSLRRCVAGPDPEASLQAAVLEARASGVEKRSLVADLEELRRELRASGTEGVEDIVLDMMDRIIGWCGPHARIP